jgi:catechol 2,3-dioxygenase-like lactoylglutathione lyase family enzyme
MINGLHALLYSTDAPALRNFFRDVLGFPYVDAHEGWLIFAMPPAELGMHPAAPNSAEAGIHNVSLMCDDIKSTVAELQAKGANFRGPVEDRRYGLVATIELPGGGFMDLYQPRHPVALGMRTNITAKKTTGTRKVSSRSKQTSAKKRR